MDNRIRYLERHLINHPLDKSVREELVFLYIKHGLLSVFSPAYKKMRHQCRESRLRFRKMMELSFADRKKLSASNRSFYERWIHEGQRAWATYADNFKCLHCGLIRRQHPTSGIASTCRRYDEGRLGFWAWVVTWCGPPKLGKPVWLEESSQPVS